MHIRAENIERTLCVPITKALIMTEASRDPDVADSENTDNGRTTLNLTCSTSNKKPLPDRGTWSTKLDFILSVVMHHIQIFYSMHHFLKHTFMLSSINY